MAKVQAKWRTHKFEISPKVIKSLEGLTLSRALKYETKENAGGKDKIVNKGYELENIPLAYTAAVATGAMPTTELDSWRADLGKKGNLYIGGKRWGVSKYILTKANLSAIMIDNKGFIPIAQINIELAEDYKDTSLKDDKKKETKTSAVDVGPSKAEKKKIQGGVGNVKARKRSSSTVFTQFVET